MKTAARPQTDGTGSVKNKKKKKKKYTRLYILVFAVLFSLFLAWGFAPVQGSIQYGICKVFIEKQVSYPLYMDIISVLERPSDVRIDYTVVNEFGDTLFNSMTCVFRPDPVTGIALSGVLLNRQKLDQQEIATFNATIPVIIANPPDLALPSAMSGSLTGLWRPPRYQ